MRRGTRLSRCVSFGVVLGVLLCCLVFAGDALALGDATTAPGEACPNEASSGFRAFMPECRGYEQVTPVFKDAAELEPLDLAENGFSMLAETLGAFAGDESDSETHGSVYELSRTTAGWAVSPVSPPASMFPAQSLAAASPELGSTLWVARTPTESIAAENLYVREADGVMVKVGAMLPPSAETGPASGEFEGFVYAAFVKYRDASAALSHVLFGIIQPSTLGVGWPGDTTQGKESLYEYSGTDQASPELVGVNNEGSLISPCSTYLGSDESEDIYNAVSLDGSRVFFTAGAASECGAPEGPTVPELYARIGGLETVSISEPTPQQCAECQTGVEAPAEFAGASGDGSKVFFLTTQELLPGAVGMNLYEYNFEAPEGEHVSLVSSGSVGGEVQGVARVSEDGSHVYFVSTGRLGKGPRGGVGGPCLAELGSAEAAEEVAAEEEELKAEPVTSGSRCRPREGEDNLYVVERDATHPAGKVSFVATLASSDENDWEGRDLRRVQATPDGRFLVFRSTADLTAGDTSTQRQLFEYDDVTGELVRVSRGSDGDEPQGTESANEHAGEIPDVQQYYNHTGPGQPATDVVVSNDGSVVVFADSGVLTGEPGEAAGAAYEYRSSVASGGSIGDGDVYLISDGAGVAGKGVNAVEGLDSSGGDVFFKTAASLTVSDSDEQFDTYDARVDGGFLAPDPPVECVAEACGSVYVVPSFAAPGSTVVSGGGSSVPVVTSAPVVSSPPPVSVKPGAVVLSRAQRLTKALRACVRVRKSKRGACEVAALRRFGPHRKAKRTGGTGK